LQKIGQSLEEYGKTFSDYGLPEPMSYSCEVEHELVKWASDHNHLSLRADNAADTFNPEQRFIYDIVITSAIQNLPLCLFIDGKAGTGKTYLVQTICDKIWSLGCIILPTATAAFAAQHYQGGRTTHSAFKVMYSTTISSAISDAG
jgi:chromosomal replication initiation ATPase DnaA